MKPKKYKKDVTKYLTDDQQSKTKLNKKIESIFEFFQLHVARFFSNCKEDGFIPAFILLGRDKVH